MNAYAIIILVTLVLDFVISLIAEILNLKALRDELPDEFKGCTSADAYRKSQQYTRARTRFGFITSTFDLVVILAFWFLRGFNVLDGMVRHWNLNSILTGLAYTGILVVAKVALTMPFRIYSTFVIEERFGLNKTTPRIFIADLLKGLLLGVMLGAPALAGILAFFQYSGPAAWLYCWLATTIFLLFVQFVAPTWIMPWFNKFTPLPDGELRQAIVSYAQSVNYPLKNLFVMDGSKRSTKANAFFMGFGKNKRIALFDTLIERNTVPGLVAVLAHEIGHYKKRHILQGLAISILHMGILFYLLSLFMSQRGLFEAFYLDHSSIYVGLIVFSMLYSPVEMILSVFMQMLSRRNEYQADRYAVATTGAPEPMINALKELSVQNLSNLTPHPFHVFLNYSHPPILKRIGAIRAAALEDSGSPDLSHS